MIKSQWGWIFNGGSIFCHFVTVLYDLSALQGKYSNCLRHERCIGADNYAKQVTIQAGHRDYWDGAENTERKRVNRLCALSVLCETLRVLCVPKQIPKQNIWHKVGTRITFDEGVVMKIETRWQEWSGGCKSSTWTLLIDIWCCCSVLVS